MAFFVRSHELVNGRQPTKGEYRSADRSMGGRPWDRLMVLGLTMVVMATAQCTASRTRMTLGPAEPFPAYLGEEATLFDDLIDLGSDSELALRPKASELNRLAQRVRRADSVVPSKICAVTRDTDGRSIRYQLQATVDGAPLAGSLVFSSFLMTVPQSNQSFGLVRNSEEQLVGQRLILFLRRYVQDGEVVVHWHATRDSPEIRKAVTEAALLRTGAQ